MANGRFGSYTSFFGERIANTTSNVAQLVSAKNATNIKSSLSHQYVTCQSNLKALASSNSVTRIKDNLGSCKQVALSGYEKAKVSVSEVIESKPVQSAATSLKENAVYCQSVAKSGSTKLKTTITEAIGPKIVESMNQHCNKYTDSIAENYNFTKDKLNKLMESEEIIRLKSIFDGSMNAVTSVNLLFDLGLKFFPETDSSNVTLQCSKYLIASIIFVISACKSYDIRKQDYITHEHMGLYQEQIDEAYDIISQLQKVFANIESLLQASYGQAAGSSAISSKDFEVDKNDFIHRFNQGDSNDINLLIKALLDGATKSSWVKYLIKLLALSFPVIGSFNVFFVTTALIYTTMSALYKYQLRAHDESRIDLLQSQLKPICAMLQHLENKLYADQENNQNNVGHEIANLSNETFLEIDFNAMTEGVAKTSGLYFVLQAILKTYTPLNYVICLGVLLFEVYDLHTSKLKQQNHDGSFKDLESSMAKLVAMIEKMKKLLIKQENYQKYLVESNKAREDFRKEVEAYKLEMLKQADEERQQVKLKQLEEEHQEELRKLNLAREQELKKIIAAQKQEELRKFVELQKELIKSEVVFSLFEDKNVVLPPPQEIMIDKNVKPSLITDLSLLKEKYDAKDSKVNHYARHYYAPAVVGGIIGAGVGWLLGVCIVTLLAVPTFGLSLVVPAICALITGAISGLMIYKLSNTEPPPHITNFRKENKRSTMFYRRENSVLSEHAAFPPIGFTHVS